MTAHLDEQRLVRALNAHIVWMEYRLHVCTGDGCAASIAREYARAEAPPKPKRERIDWSNVVVDEGDEAP